MSKTRKVKVIIQRNYFQEANIEADVPVGLTGYELQEFVENDIQVQEDLERAISFTNQEYDETKVTVEELPTKEYKIKWEIELDATNPEEAAKMALDLIQSPDSTAKIFEVDGEMVDVSDEEVDEQALWLPIVTKLAGPGPFEFGGKDYLIIENKEYVLYLWYDKTKFDMETEISNEIIRGAYRDVWYTLDRKDQ